MKSKPMKQQPIPEEDEMLPEYDFKPSEGEIGKYYKQLRERGAILVLLEPDVARVFKDAESVNAALRDMISISEKATKQEIKEYESSEKIQRRRYDAP